MFIKEVIKKNKGYDKTFIYHQLVESYRTEKGPRQRRLLDLGKLTIPKSQWKNLANPIEEILHGQTRLLEEDPQIEALAQHYASLLIHSRLKQKKPEEKQKAEPRYESVGLNSIRTRQSRSVGAEYVALMMLKKLDLEELLWKLNLKEEHIKLAELLIIGRMVKPASGYATVRWAK